MNPAYSISRTDRAWHPHAEMTPALYLVPHRGGRRHSARWRPGLGQDPNLLGGAVSGAAGAAGGILAAWNAPTKDAMAQDAATAAASAATGVTSLLATIGTVSAATVPLVGAIAAGGLLLATLVIKAFSGCGQSCTLTSEAANEIEKALQQNQDAYFAIPAGERTKSIQAAALANFDNTWAKLVQYCGNPSFGSAGKRCVTDREQGACKWQDSNGNCFNWFSGYRSPIANDAAVPDAVPGAASQVKDAVNQIFGGGSGSASAVNLTPVLLIGGAALLAWALL